MHILAVRCRRDCSATGSNQVRVAMSNTHCSLPGYQYDSGPGWIPIRTAELGTPGGAR